MGISQAMGPDALRAGVVDDTAGRPASPFEGQLIFQKDTNQLLIWDGSAWVMIGDTDAPPALQRITDCGVSSAGGTAATASNGVITVGTSNTSVTVTSAFGSGFDNYRVVYNGIETSATNALTLTLNGSTGSTYQDGGFYIGTGAAAITVESTVNRTSFRIGIVESGPVKIAGWFDVFGPNISGRTWVNGGSMTSGFFNWRQGTDTNTASHTGFSLIPVLGNLTGGTIRVYGYRN